MSIDFVENKELFDRLIKAAVAMCASRKGVSSLSYDRQIFWELYKRILDDFVANCPQITTLKLETRWGGKRRQFDEGVWQGFFLNEIESILDTDDNFGSLVVQAAKEKKKYFYFTEKIDCVLRKRYAIQEEN